VDGSAGTFAAVRGEGPDSLLEGEAPECAQHEGLENGLFPPGSTRTATVAYFTRESVRAPEAWGRRRSGLPVIVDAPAEPT
jgi:hypothetical protein